MGCQWVNLSSYFLFEFFFETEDVERAEQLLNEMDV